MHKRQRLTNGSPIASPPPSGAFAVLTCHALLSRITDYQRGIPMLVLDLVKLFQTHDDWHQIVDPMNGIGLYWSSVMRHGDLTAVQLLCRARQTPELAGLDAMKIDDLVAFAAKCGRLDVIQWLHTDASLELVQWSGSLLYLAIHHDELARWLLRNRPEACVENITGCQIAAAGAGNLEMLRELITRHRDAVTAAVMDEALRNRQWQVIRYLHHNSAVGCSPRGMDAAAAHGHLDVVQFLHDHRVEGCTKAAMDSAASRGDLTMVQFLHENRVEGCTKHAMDNAAANGHLHVVQFLHEHRGEGCTTEAMDKAAAEGRLNVVRYLHENRTEGCTENALMRAARSQHLDVVEFLHKQCQMEAPEWLLKLLLKDGNLKAVQYLHEDMHVPFDHESIRSAKASQNEALAKYVESQQHGYCVSNCHSEVAPVLK